MDMGQKDTETIYLFGWPIWLEKWKGICCRYLDDMLAYIDGKNETKRCKKYNPG